jgi:hypothetical protein
MGAPKPQLLEMQRFSARIAEIAPEGWETVAADSVIVVPEHLEKVLPFTIQQYRDDIRDNLFQSYIAAREADLRIRMVREEDGIPGGASLYLLPSNKMMSAPGARRLSELAAAGATVYMSYFAGSTANQRGPWIAGLEELFGVRQSLRYGLVDPITDDVVTFEFLEDLGELSPGSRLSFKVAGTPSARCFLPVEPVDAKVLAVDGAGRPALLRHSVRNGSTVLCTYPIEHMAARLASANPEDTWRLYSALASAAGAKRPVRVADPRVLAGGIRTGDGEIAVYVNCSSDQVILEPILAGSLQSPGLGDGAVLAPFGVATAPFSQVQGDLSGNTSEPGMDTREEEEGGI